MSSSWAPGTGLSHAAAAGQAPPSPTAAAFAAATAAAAAGMQGQPAAGGGGGGGNATKFRKQGLVAVVRTLHQQYTSGALEAQALAVQNGLDVVASALERLLALVTGLDVVASSLFYSAVLLVAVAWARFGLGSVVFTFVVFLLRPPFLRAVPGWYGPAALASNLPVRCMEQLSA